MTVASILRDFRAMTDRDKLNVPLYLIDRNIHDKRLSLDLVAKGRDIHRMRKRQYSGQSYLHLNICGCGLSRKMMRFMANLQARSLHNCGSVWSKERRMFRWRLRRNNPRRSGFWDRAIPPRSGRCTSPASAVPQPVRLDDGGSWGRRPSTPMGKTPNGFPR
jgi:hypothetical protein